MARNLDRIHDEAAREPAGKKTGSRVPASLRKPGRVPGGIGIRGWDRGSVTAALTELQRSVGNAAVQRMVAEAGRRMPGAGGRQTLPPWRASGQLWYFSGARSEGDTPTTVQVAGRPRVGADDLRWNLVEGADRVRLNDGGSSATGTSVQLESIAGSNGRDDVTLRVTAHEPDGVESASYEGKLGVRHPVALRAVGPQSSEPATGVSPAAYPLEGQADNGVQDSAGQLPDDTGGASSGDETVQEAPDNGPARSMNPTGPTHAAHPTFMYETHENYQVVDDTGSPVTSFDVNEKFTTPPTADAPGCNWRRGPEGGAHVNGSTFFDNMQGETSSHTPTPQNPQSPLGATKVQHWNQEWRVGSVTPGEGTLIQTNLFQKYLDHAAHENQAQL